MSVAFVVVAAYAGFGLLLLFLQPRFMYRPGREVLSNPSNIDLGFEAVTLRTEDGLSLSAWFVPAAGAGYTVLFCHGNGGNISHRLDTLRLFHRLGVSCLIFDYRGYGTSEGSPSEAGTYRDAMAAWRWLTDTKGIPAERIVVFGRSMGASIAAWLAAEVRPAGMVVESAFTSFVDMGKEIYPWYPVRWFARFGYDTRAYVSRAACPVLVIHSRDDELIPFSHGRALFAAAPDPKQFLEIVGSHNEGYLLSLDAYKQGWRNWLAGLDNPAGVPQP